MGEQPTPEMPEVPTQMMTGALALRELYVSFVAAGFSDYQACVMLGTAVAQMMGGKAEES